MSRTNPVTSSPSRTYPYSSGGDTTPLPNLYRGTPQWAQYTAASLVKSNMRWRKVYADMEARVRRSEREVEELRGEVGRLWSVSGSTSGERTQRTDRSDHSEGDPLPTAWPAPTAAPYEPPRANPVFSPVDPTDPTDPTDGSEHEYIHHGRDSALEDLEDDPQNLMDPLFPFTVYGTQTDQTDQTDPRRMNQVFGLMKGLGAGF